MTQDKKELTSKRRFGILCEKFNLNLVNLVVI